MTKKILYIQYTNPAFYPPLEHSSTILAGRDWNIVFLGIDSRAENVLCFPAHSNRRVKKLGYCGPGLIQKFHYILYCLWVVGWVVFWRPAWIYASDLFSCPPALFVSLFGKKIIYHEHDSPSNGIKNNSFFMRCIIKTRKELSKKSRFSILPNEDRVKHFASEMGGLSNVFCVWNCASISEIKVINKAEDNIILYYHGNANPIYLPLTLLEAMQNLPEHVLLKIIAYETIGYGGYLKKFIKKAGDLKIDHRVQLIEPQPRYKLFDYAGKCHLGICFNYVKTDTLLNNRYLTGASNKAFDFLACGLPLLVSDLLDWKKMYVETGYGLACDPEDPKSIANAIQWFLDHPEDMRKMGENGRMRIASDWNYEKQFEPVLEQFTC